MTDKQKPPRSCGDCAACCHVLGVPFAKAGERCRHVVDGVGCAIYGDHPVECQAYGCAWLWGLWDDDDRPDRLGVIIDTADSPGLEYLTAREVRPDASLDIGERLQKLACDGFKAGGRLHKVPVRLECADGDRFIFHPDGRVETHERKTRA